MGDTDEFTIFPQVMVRCIWRIKNYSQSRQSFYTEFSSGALSKTVWQLRADPPYIYDSEFLSIQLKLVTSGKPEVATKFKFCLLNTQQEESIIFEGESVFTEKITYDCKEFCAVEYLLNQSNKLLPYDILTILCELTELSGKESLLPTDIKFDVPTSRLSDDLRQLLESKKFYDVTLIVERREFLAHKAVLAARSPVFEAMFTHNMEEKKNNRVVITDIDEEVLEEMLRFIYTGRISNMIDEKGKTGDLIAAADKYNLEILKIMCEKQLCKKMCVENASEMLILADVLSAQHLKSCAIDFIKQNAINIIETLGWKTKILAHPHLALETFRALALK